MRPAQRTKKPKPRWARAVLAVLGGVVGAAVLAAGVAGLYVYQQLQGMGEMVKYEHFDQDPRLTKEVGSLFGTTPGSRGNNWDDEPGTHLTGTAGTPTTLPVRGVVATESTDPAVVRVVGSGEVLGVSRGHVRVDVTLENGKTLPVWVTVEGAAQ